MQKLYIINNKNINNIIKKKINKKYLNKYNIFIIFEQFITDNYYKNV